MNLENEKPLTYSLYNILSCTKEVYKQGLLVVLFFSITVSSLWAERWTILSFQSDGTNATPQFNATDFPTWNVLLRDPVNTEWVNSGSICGISERVGGPNDRGYFGIQGTTPISLTKGNQIIVTFANRTGSMHTLWPRVSVTDPDSPASFDTGYYGSENPPAGTQPGSHWHTATTNGGGRDIPAGQSASLYLNITDLDSVLALHSHPSQGNRTSINVSLWNQNSSPGDFVLTRIEISDEADLATPAQITDIEATLTTISQEAGASAVELSWSTPTDYGSNGGLASGVSRYFIYRDGQLHALVNRDWMRRYPDHIGFTDNRTIPGATHVYEITALDSAATGMYPVELGWLNTMDKRCGNESPRSNAISVTMPTWSSTELLSPHADLTYQGAFLLPANTEWSYGVQTMTFCPGGNSNQEANELPGSLYASGHDYNLNIGEISIPQPVISQDINQLPRARQIRDFADPYPAAYNGEKIPSGSVATVRRLAYHPGDNQVPEGIYYTICRYYGGDTSAATFGRFNLDLTQANGPWHAGAAPGNTSHIPFYYATKLLMSAPSSWAQNATGGRSLLLGLGWDIAGVGRPSAGPTFAAVAPGETGSLPPMYGVVSAVNLLRYQAVDEDGYQILPGKWELNWNQNCGNYGAVWLKAGDKNSIVISAQFTSGDEWYGSDEGASDNHIIADLPNGRDNRNMFKGPNSSRIHQVLKFYNPKDLERVAQGAMQRYEPQPYSCLDLRGFIRGGIRGIASDNNTGTLFVASLVEQGNVIIHVWKAVGGNTSPITRDLIDVLKEIKLDKENGQNDVASSIRNYLT